MTPELQALKDKTLASMVDYMRNDEEDADHDPEFDPGYTQAEVDRCAEIVDEYLATLAAIDEASEAKRDAAILAAVERVVLQLNRLNEDSEGSLIETDQREDLCELIIAAASHAGLETEGEDITEEWREW
ncbi:MULTISPECIES: hypothetical protein [unclassified Variovorax]|jgi:hypothetical protein|uniref:hypothetical protein n=1 Tax=unclassified Variovorax TaxID=663243 RepID=UPI0008ED8296|nr:MULTISPECIES: hypothetical protein [unclassified Variovorax]KAF1066784.1 MAG: hypothetical protein GAK39_04625 [Variovorax sp.]TAJ63354.1 MAG: hypothetical protein EPO53_15570 [Variovorax sp.]SFP10089.1 hypothetical protein SAMN05443579_108349 [Variovorax sp. PDC80]